MNKTKQCLGLHRTTSPNVPHTNTIIIILLLVCCCCCCSLHLKSIGQCIWMQCTRRYTALFLFYEFEFAAADAQWTRGPLVDTHTHTQILPTQFPDNLWFYKFVGNLLRRFIIIISGDACAPMRPNKQFLVNSIVFSVFDRLMVTSHDCNAEQKLFHFVHDSSHAEFTIFNCKNISLPFRFRIRKKTKKQKKSKNFIFCQKAPKLIKNHFSITSRRSLRFISKFKFTFREKK